MTDARPPDRPPPTRRLAAAAPAHADRPHRPARPRPRLLAPGLDRALAAPRTARPRPTTSSSSRSLSAVYGYIHWMVTRWRFEGDTLRIETGLIRKDSRRLPLARIQAVDIVRPLLGPAARRVRAAHPPGRIGSRPTASWPTCPRRRRPSCGWSSWPATSTPTTAASANTGLPMATRRRSAGCSARSSSRWSPSS